MCKRINRFIPVLFVSSIVLTILAGAVIAVTGVNIPLWGSYLISQAIVLLPALVYVAVHKINIIACIPETADIGRTVKLADWLYADSADVIYQQCIRTVFNKLCAGICAGTGCISILAAASDYCSTACVCGRIRFPWIDLSFLQKKWNFRGSGA